MGDHYDVYMAAIRKPVYFFGGVVRINRRVIRDALNSGWVYAATLDDLVDDIITLTEGHTPVFLKREPVVDDFRRLGHHGYKPLRSDELERAKLLVERKAKAYKPKPRFRLVE